MCWPLSSVRPLTFTLRARPPSWPAISNSVIAWPSSVACTAAAKPAQPPPTTATRLRPELTSVGLPLCAGRHPELTQRRQRRALVQHLETVVFDLSQQRPVNVGHHQAGPLRLAIGLWQQRQRLVVGVLCALRLEAHQLRETLAVTPRRLALQDLGGLDAEALHLVHRQVDAAAPGVVADIADDVGQLQRAPQRVR